MGGQQRPPCQQRRSVNRRKRRIGRKNVGLQRQPWGSVLDADNRVFKLEKATVLNTCGMFGITRMAGRHAVNENGAAIWGYRVVAPQKAWYKTTSPGHKSLILKANRNSDGEAIINKPGPDG